MLAAVRGLCTFSVLAQLIPRRARALAAHLIFNARTGIRSGRSAAMDGGRSNGDGEGDGDRTSGAERTDTVRGREAWCKKSARCKKNARCKKSAREKAMSEEHVVEESSVEERMEKGPRSTRAWRVARKSALCTRAILTRKSRVRRALPAQGLVPVPTFALCSRLRPLFPPSPPSRLKLFSPPNPVLVAFPP